jgi:hypothetical protein
MISYVDLSRYVKEIFSDLEGYDKLSEILYGLIRSRSLRISMISRGMRGSYHRNYKLVQRFMRGKDIRELLFRFFDSGSKIVIGDATEIERPEADKTRYVGGLKDKRKGFLLLNLATPYNGRAIPFWSMIFSSKTLSDDLTSRNLEYENSFRQVKGLIGDRPLVFDRELSSEGFLKFLLDEKINFIIRLNLESRVKLYCDRGEGRLDDIGDELRYLKEGQTKRFQEALYKGKIKVNIIATRLLGRRRPLAVMTNLEDIDQALKLYKMRMKIEQSFKDGKDKLGLDKIMSQKRENAQKMISLLLILFCILLLVGEQARSKLKKEDRFRYSGVFITLFLWDSISDGIKRFAIITALTIMRHFRFNYVRTPV